MEFGAEIRESKQIKQKGYLDDQTVNELTTSYLQKHDWPDDVDLRAEINQQHQDLFRFTSGESDHKSFFERLKVRKKQIDRTSQRLFDFAEHWEIFSSSDRIKSIFGKDNLNNAEERLSRLLVNLELSHGNRERELNKGDTMYAMGKLKNSIVAPFVILNKYNSFNYHGQKDFGFKDVQEYLSGFSQEKAEKLKTSSVLGLKELKELADNTSQARREDLVKFKLEVTKMALDYLQNGTLEEKLYMASVVSLKFLSFDTSNQILQILESNATAPEIVKKFFTSQLSLERASNNILKIRMLFEYLSRHGNPELLELLKFNEGLLLDQFINQTDLSLENFSMLSRVFGESKKDVKSAIEFARKQKELNPEFHLSHHERSTEGTLSKLIRLTTNKDIHSLLAELSTYGYSLTTYQSGLDLDLFDLLLKKKETLLPFIQELHEKGGYSFDDIGEVNVLEELIHNKDYLISALSDIRKYAPDFRYHISHYGEEHLNPYRQFISYINASSGFSYSELVAIKKDKQNIPPEFSDPLFDSLRQRLLLLRDASLRKKYSDLRKTDVPPERKAAFGKAINTVVEYVQKHSDLEWFYQDKTFLGILTIRPEEAGKMASLPERYPELITLMQEGGPLYTNRENILSDIFAGEDFDIQAQEIVTIFTKKQPYWEILYLYTEKRLRSQLINAETSYPIVDSDSNRRRPFNSLSEQEKLKIFKEYLRIVIESSRSTTAKKASDEKNRESLEKNLTLVEGDYIHGTAIDYLDKILLNGNLCGEALGQYARSDSRPFHVDFSRVEESQSKATSDIIERSMSVQFGNDGKNGQNGQMFLILKRKNSSYEREVDYRVGPGYALMFTGIPSTAIDAIVLRNPSVALESVKYELVENGFYLPVYDLKGNLIFSPQDYDDLRYDENIINVPVEVWDYSLKSGGQRGSNPAAEFTILEEQGPAKYYVKFKTIENEDQIWNELLADSIYRTLGIPMPATKIVRVNGEYGHASKLLPDIIDGTAQSQDWKKGYLADCLLANWDILSALEQNTVTSIQTNEVFRVDNGGALLYRARGERKEEKDFPNTVKEIEESSPFSPAKMGISGEMLKMQAKLLKERLQNDVIDNLIDSVRLKKADREHLKIILKERRDFIILKFLGI